MSVLILQVTTGRPDTYLNSNFETAGGGRQIAERVKQFVERVYTGNELGVGGVTAPSIAISVRGQTTQASGTLTLSSVVATNTCAINGVTFTAIASGATGNQFNVGADDTATAVNLAAAINASVTALVSGYVTASSSLGVVTVTSAFYSQSGNQTTLTGSANIVASGARLTGGAVDASAQTLSF